MSTRGRLYANQRAEIRVGVRAEPFMSRRGQLEDDITARLLDGSGWV